jgi:hypothetical protein
MGEAANNTTNNTANNGENQSQAGDPFEPFRAVRDKYLDAMAKTMVETVNTESYAQATGAMLEGYLTATTPLREAMDKSMSQALQQLSLPSRQEVAALAERFTHMEMRLDDMDAKLDRIERLLGRKQMDPPPDAGKIHARSEAEEGVNAQSGAAGDAGRLGARGRFARKGSAPGKRSRV